MPGSRGRQQTTNETQARGIHRLFWVFVAVLLLIAALNVIATVWLPGAIQRWLHEHGLEAQVSNIHLSLPRLRADLRGVDVRNKYGRGFRAREATLGLSWRDLLRGEIRAKVVEIEGAHLDMETEPGNGGRIWEIGGWRLEPGEKRPKNWRVELASVRVRDGVVCYRHKPEWSTSSCARIGNLALQDFFVSGFRAKDEPLTFSIGAEDLKLKQLLAWEERPSGNTGEPAEGDMKKSGREHPFIAAVELEAENARFDRPDNRLVLDEILAQKFAGCTPERWTAVIGGLRNIVGHCATARRLHGSGSEKTPLAFTFGKEARVQWLRLDGQEIRLRHVGRAYPNWRAQTIALDRFDYQRTEKSLEWQSAGATQFDWCPNNPQDQNNWRGKSHHFCLRAGSLRLPKPVTMHWPQGYTVAFADATATQLSLLDVAATGAATSTSVPVTANNLHLAALEYRNRQRRLHVSGTSLDSINGCIPAPLLGAEKHCVQLRALGVPETLTLQFPRANGEYRQPWALESGPFALARLQLEKTTGTGGKPMLVEKLHWAEARLQPAVGEYLLRDVGLTALRGCLPAAKDHSPGALCAQASKLIGDGNFVWQQHPGGWLASWGELQLDALQLSDQLESDGGVRLAGLHWQHGLLRRQQRSDGGELFPEGFFTGDPPVDSGLSGDIAADGAEKGLLAEELKSLPDFFEPSPQGADSAPGDSAGGDSGIRATTELEQAGAQLARVDGCLPASWTRLLYGAEPRPQSPACFLVRELQQKKPLTLALQSAGAESPSGVKFHFSAEALSLTAAELESIDDNKLLILDTLSLPHAEIRFANAPVRAQVQLPNATLARGRWCGQPARCIDLSALRTGERFTLAYDRHQFSADLNDLALEQLQINGSASGLSARVEELQSLQLHVRLPRIGGQSADWRMRDLQAARLDVCLPAQTENPDSPTRGTGGAARPRCLHAEKLNSHGSGLALQQLALASGPQQPPQIQVGNLTVARIAMRQPSSGPLQLNLHDIDLQAVDGCGLKDWLPARGAASQWAGCLQSGRLHLSGDNLLGIGGDSGGDASGDNAADRIALGPLRGEGLSLKPPSGGVPLLQLDSVRWQSFGWSGGSEFRLKDFEVNGFNGCMPSVQNTEPYCADVARLALPGNQQLSLGETKGASGSIQLTDFHLRKGDRVRLAVDVLALEGLAVSGDRMSVDIGEITGIQGCLPEVGLKLKKMNLCVEVGRVSMARNQPVKFGQESASGGGRRFYDLLVEGLKLTQRGAPADASAKIMQIETLRAELLAISTREVLGKNLQLDGVSSCLPAGIISGVDHCLNIETVSGSGRYQLDTRNLELALLDLSQVRIVGDDGERLLEAEFAQVRQLQASTARVQFEYLQVDDARVFRRKMYSQEFIHRQWNTEFETLQINRFDYLSGGRSLEIGTIELMRPRTILARDIQGGLGAWERFRDSETATEAASQRRVRISRSASRFHYAIGEVYIDHGDFLWLDNSHEYRVSLPIQRINLLMRNISSRQEDPPALVLVNGRPGGFGELQVAGQLDLLENSHWNAGLLGYVTDANLIPATPYIAGLLGYKILQGQLDAEVNIQVEDNQVDALAKMALEKIKVRRVRDTDHLKVKKSFIPLGLALALLKDGNGDVHFNMPVTGDLFDPEFKFSFIFSDLLQRAILESLFAYFTPVGFYSLAKLAWARFRAVSFDPIEFAPGNSELSAVAKTQLLGMVEKMRDNPQARPGVCGVATARDLEAMFPHDVASVGGGGNREVRDDFYRDPPRGIREELLNLSGLRSHHVQKFLIEAGLDAEDFIQCAPDYIGTDSDEPRVELSH